MSTATPPRPVSQRTPGAPRRPERAPMLSTNIDPIRVLRRHVIGIGASVFVGTILGVIAYFLLSKFYPLYSGRVFFEVHPGLQKAGDVGTFDHTNDDVIYRIAQTETHMLLSRPILLKALEHPDIRTTSWYNNFITDDGEFSPELAADELEKKLSATVVRNSNLFSLNWSTHVSSDVPKVLNAIETAYINERRERDRAVFAENLKLFDDQLVETQRALENLAQEMQKMIREAGMTTLDDTHRSAQFYQNEQLTLQLTYAAANLNFAETALQQVKRQIGGIEDPSYADILAAERDPAVASQIESIQYLKAELQRLYKTREPGSPMIQQLEARLRAAEEARDAKIKEIIRRNLEARQHELTEAVDRYRQAVEGFESELERNRKLLNDLAAKQSEYEALRMRRENLEAKRTAELELKNEVQLMRLRADASRVRTAQRALEPRRLSFPREEIVIPLGALLTMGLTVGFIFLRELMDQRVKTVSDLAVLPGARVLGGIPDLEDDPSKTKAKAAELVVRKHPTSVLAESYRQAATSLLPLMDRNGHQTLLLVGGLPGAGTTTVVTNLAAAAAAAGRRVLVVDANFRRPRLAKAMGVSDVGPGLGDLLSDAATLEQAIIDTGDGISVISAGTPANRVFDRLSNGAFDSLVAELREQFDLILFDAPPAVVAGDALALANRVDAAVLVVRAHQEERGLVVRVMNRLAEARCEMLGLLLNRPRGITGGYLRKNYATMAEYTTKAS